MVEEELVDTQQLLPLVYHDAEVLVERRLLVERSIGIGIEPVLLTAEQFVYIVTVEHNGQLSVSFLIRTIRPLQMLFPACRSFLGSHHR